MKASLSLLFWLALGSLTWFSLVGKFDVQSLLLGIIVILSAWGLGEFLSQLRTKTKWGVLTVSLKSLFGYLFKVVIPGFLQGAFFVARASLGRGPKLNPMLIAVAPPGATKEALLLLAIGISMSPDQQVVAVDDDRGILYVHVMHGQDMESARKTFLEHYHDFVKEAVPK